MAKYEEIDPCSSKQICSIVSGNLYNTITINKIVPKGRFKSISAYIEYLLIEDNKNLTKPIESTSLKIQERV